MRRLHSMVFALCAALGAESQVRFQVTAGAHMLPHQENGRLFVVLSGTGDPEPRLRIGETELASARVFARDARGFGSGSSSVVTTSDEYYPHDPLPCREGEDPPLPPPPLRPGPARVPPMS